MTVKDITDHIETIAPLQNAEDFDNVGLLVGNFQSEVSGVLVTLDTLESVVDEAIKKGCNLIVSFHPIIFSGLKKLNGNSYVERTVLKAIKKDIAIYAMHTALDNNPIRGVSAQMAEILGLQYTKVLIPKTGFLKKLSTYVPNKDADKVRRALFEAGAGAIGNYSHCSYNMLGLGTYLGNENSNPSVGQKGVLQQEKETFISVIFEKHLETKVMKALLNAHPYEEVAYEVVTTDNRHQLLGMGIVGELPIALEEVEFLNLLKSTFKLHCIRHSEFLGKPIKKVAVLGGSGSFAIEAAKRAGADTYISADFKYHEFFKAEKELLLIDVGHYESEQYTKNLLVEHLNKKFTNFAIILSETNTNPIHYH